MGITDQAYTLTKSAMDTLDPAIPYAASSERAGLADPLPDTYIVGTLISDVPEQHADDEETEAFFRMQLSLYSKAGLLDLPNTDTAMLAVGFKRAGSRELPYDPDTQHYGLARDYTLLIDL